MIAAALALLMQAQQAPGLERAAIQPPTPTAAAIAADTGVLRHPNGRTPPIARAVRLTSATPHIDGKLDDPAWTDVAPITDLYQNAPDEGRPASQRTEVRILYDDDAIYVAARMYDTEPLQIRSPLARRDNISSSDYIEIDFDSYHDHRTSFQFSVTPSGVKADAIGTGDNTSGDRSWDPVWEVSTRRDSTGWTAEMRIPLSQLRFSPATEQVWGINVIRNIQRRGERSELGWKAQTENGFPSWFGHLFGLSQLPQPRRLEVMPYAAGRQEYTGAVAGDPFHTGSRTLGAGGLDLKYGLTSNLTVDATFNPDFGQVEQDPAYVNLGPFEQAFQERRPFFVEGANIFSFGGSQFFYSRRIGTTPHGGAEHSGYVDSPDKTTILGASKLTGRTGSGWSVGVLEALTSREFATVDSSGTRFSDEVEPVTNFFIGRIKKDLRSGATTIGGMFTAVNRDLRGPQLRFLRSAGYAGGLDFTHKFAHNAYSLTGSIAASYIRGDTMAINSAQRSSARYYQRPDADYVHFDSSRTSLSGWSGRASLSKIQGNLTWYANAGATSPGFEINDAGFLRRTDAISSGAGFTRRWTIPGTVFRGGNIGSDVGLGWNFGGVRNNSYAGAYAYGQLLNYWSIQSSVFVNFRTLSDVLTRGGPLGVGPAGANLFAGVGSDSRKPWQAFLGGYVFRNEIASSDIGMFLNLTLRPSTSVQVDMNPGYDRYVTAQQYLQTSPDPLNGAMYGNQYIFARVTGTSLDLTTRVNMTFSPRLSLQLFVQPFISTGAYDDFKELSQPRTVDYLHYGTTPGSTLQINHDSTTGDIVSYTVDPDGAGARPSVEIANPDFNVRSLRGTAVLRWEYRPGSTLFLVWSQNCGYYSQASRMRFRDLAQLCQGASTNVFAVKFNYWLSL